MTQLYTKWALSSNLSFGAALGTLTNNGEEWRLVHSVLTRQHSREVDAQHQQTDRGATKVEEGCGHKVEALGEGEDRDGVAL